MVDDSENLSSRSDGLRTLRPEYIESEHKLYVDELNRALQMPGVRNIALSGPYGVGKSSILQGFRKGHPEAIFISLSTLGFRESKNHHSTTESSEKSAVSGETNRIQKEIVKQLLYRAAPNKLPASRFKRIHRMTKRHRAAVSCVVGFFAALVMVTLGGMAKIPMIGWSTWPDFGVRFAGVWSAAFIAALASSPLLEGRVHLDKIAAGSTTISLSRDNDTYFDEYLDEIMYFFEVERKGKDTSEKTVVVFEDIDRFDNVEIFEELRELNTLLNNSKQLDKNKRSKSLDRARKTGKSEEGAISSPIVFIYAMKDSIFDASSSANGEEADGSPSPSSDKAALEAERANRTKFFDLIIPVVPFVTHQSARDLMRQELEDVQWKVSDDLINRTSRYVPELRVIRSVCNEYRVYAQRLLGEGSLDLKPDHLFAMMLYKAVHLRDYEDIRLGRSNLDAVYRTSLEVVEARIIELNQEYDNVEKEFTAENEAKRRARKFDEMVRWVAATRSENVTSFSVQNKIKTFNQDETKEPRFWSTINNMAGFDEITVVVDVRSNAWFSFSLSKDNLALFMGRDSVSTSLKTSSEDSLNARKKEIAALRENYRHVNMCDLMRDGSISALHAQRGERAEGKLLFSSYVEQTLGSPLAAMLIRDGYIDKNFILYTSVYHETSLSVNAMTFKIRHVDREEMNATYELSDDEVKNLLSDVEPEELSRPETYNIHILDYLLRSSDDADRERLGFVIEGLLRNGDDELKLLQAFFSADAREKSFGREQKMRLVSVLAPRYPAMFTVLVELQGVDDGEQRDYVDTAFQYASDGIDYDTSALKGSIENSFDEMKVFTGAAEKGNRGTVAELVKRSEAKLADLSKVEEGLRELLIIGACYAVNRSNLDAVAGSGGVSLDSLASERLGVYSYVLGALDDYLKAIGDDPDRVSAIAGRPSASKVITDVAASDLNTYGVEPRPQTDVTTDEPQLPSLKKILDVSNGEWMVDLDSVPQETWPMLAQYGRFIVSTVNLLPYIKEHGMDDSLTELLGKQNSIVAQAQLSEADYFKLAREVLGAGKLSVEKRIELVASIDWDGFIPATEIIPETGELIGSLVKAGLIADDGASYELAKNLDDWPTKEWAIECSKRTLDPAEFVGDDALKVLQSGRISNRVKQYVASDLDSYCLSSESDELRKVVEYLIAHKDFVVGGGVLRWLQGQGIGSEKIIELMAVGLSKIADQDLRGIVSALGEPYSKLLVPGGPVHVEDRPGVRDLLDALKARKIGSVSSISPCKSEAEYKVNRKRK